MKLLNVLRFCWVVVSSATVTLASPHFSRNEVRTTGASNRLMPGAYLAELNDGQDPDILYDELLSLGFEVQKRMRLNYRLFNGISFHILNATDTDETLQRQLASRSDIRNIWLLHEIPAPETNILSRSHGSSESGHLKQRGEEQSFSPHVMTQIDTLHKAGYTGKGIRVAIIDTGVDYTHPALGGCFGEGCLISYGRDLVGDEFSWDTPAEEDSDPMEDECPGSYGHGTHVAGIIAAQPNEHGFVGAAPGATLGFYKVCGGVPYLPADLVISAMNRAVEDGSDVISMSVGLGSNIETDPTALMASRIVEEGTVIAAAASNTGGFASFWTVTSPCVGGLVTCVAAVVPEEIPLFVLDGTFSIDDGPEQRYGRMQLNNPLVSFSDNTTLPALDLELEIGSDHSACEPLPDNTPDLSNHLVLVGTGDPYQLRDSTCLPDSMLPNLMEKGARYIMFYPRKAGDTRPLVLASAPEDVSVGLVPTHHAATWRKALAKGSTVNVTVIEEASATERLDIITNDDNGGFIASFSSWGPSGDMRVNPQVSAPGDFILSTFPPSAGSYTIMGGTSMATPLIAGLYALLMEALHTKDPLELLSVLSSTAKSLDWFDNESAQEFPAPVAQQGTGLVQGELASKVPATVDPVSFSFNDTVSFEGQHEITIRNNGAEEITYQLSHVEGPTAYALVGPEGLPETPVTVKPFKTGAKLKFNPSKITLAPGKSAKVKIHGTPPSKVEKSRLPLYGGWIRLKENNDESLSIPYVGLAASLGGTSVILPGRDGGTWFETFVNGTEIEEDATYIVPRPVESERAEWYVNPRAGDPMYSIHPRLPAQVIRVDIVAPDDVDLPSEDHLGYQVIGSPIDIMGPYPVRGPPRSPLTSRFTGLLWSGIVVPEGRYQIVVSALGVYGDADNDKDWDVVASPIFNLRYLDEN